MNTRKLVIGIIALLISAAMMTACTNTQMGATLGTIGGAAAGAAVGDTKGALIGAGVGAVGGGLIGNAMDQNNRLDDVEAQAAAANQAANTFTVNITNSNGSVTPVVLRRQGNVWVGPRGEQYPAIPTVEQLKPVYGF